MKGLNIRISVIIAVSVLGCRANPEFYLPKEDGEWRSEVLTYHQYQHGSLDTVWNVVDGSTYKFHKNGTGQHLQSSGTGDFTYETTSSHVSICQTFTSSGFLFGSTSSTVCLEYDVLVSTRNLQTWKRYENGTADSPDRTEVLQKLERVE